jgi:hypothetical protein
VYFVTPFSSKRLISGHSRYSGMFISLKTTSQMNKTRWAALAFYSCQEVLPLPTSIYLRRLWASKEDNNASSCKLVWAPPAFGLILWVDFASVPRASGLSHVN